MNSPTPSEAARMKCALSLAQMIDEWEGQPRNETGVDKLSNLIDLRLRRFWPEVVAPAPTETAEEVVERQTSALTAMQDALEDAEAKFDSHTKSVSAFLGELYATMIDPCASDEQMDVTTVCKELLAAAQRQREALSTLSPSPGAGWMPIMQALADAADEINGAIDHQNYDAHAERHDDDELEVHLSVKDVALMNSAICAAQQFLRANVPAPPSPAEPVGEAPKRRLAEAESAQQNETDGAAAGFKAYANRSFTPNDDGGGTK